MNKDGLGDRMKAYENISRNYLIRRMPCIIRLDGKAFHSFTRGFQRPFDTVLINTMWDTAIYLCQNIQGCKVAYTQSDEITLLLIDYDELETSAWFDKNIQKMTSVSASMATLAFNKSFQENMSELPPLVESSYRTREAYDEARRLYMVYQSRINTALFDSRVFNLPKEEVCNCFIWRQQDATRNAIQMLGQSQFSHKQLQSKNCDQIQEMLWQEKNINFNDLEVYKKRGSCIVREVYDKDGTPRSRWTVDKSIPIFTQDRNYIEQYI